MKIVPVPIAMCALILGQASQLPTFRTVSDAVLVDVTVTRGATPVSDLTINNFELKDDGVKQQIRDVTVGSVPVDVLLALDVSGSIVGEKLSALQHAGRSLIQALRPEDRIAVVSFSNSVQLEFDWSADKSAAAAALAGIRSGNRTSLYDAVSAVSLFGTVNGDVRRHLLLITDGYDTASWISPLLAIDQAKRSNLIVHVIRVGYSRPIHFAATGSAQQDRHQIFLRQPELVPTEFLPMLTQETGGDLIDGENEERLAALCLQVGQVIRATYVLSYVPAGVSASGWHSIEVSLKSARGSVVARRGYQR
jgi:Ca-activated chloride channel homolog